MLGPVAGVFYEGDTTKDESGGCEGREVA